MNTLDGWVIKQRALSDDEELGVYEAKRPRLISPAASDASTSEETVRAPVPSSSTGGSAKKRTARTSQKERAAELPGMKELREQFATAAEQEDLNPAVQICLEQVKLRKLKILTAALDFDELKKACAAREQRLCATCHTVKPLAEFTGTQNRCRSCQLKRDAGEGNSATKEQRSNEADAAAAATREAKPDSLSLSEVEDAFVQWLAPKLEALGFEFVIMREFRRADVLVCRPEWPMYVRIQAKADGGVKTDGKTVKPERERAQFHHAFGYGAVQRVRIVTQRDKKKKGEMIEVQKPGRVDVVPEHRMLMLGGCKRAKTMDALATKDYHVWCFDGSFVNTGCLCANRTHSHRLSGLRNPATGERIKHGDHGALRVRSMSKVAERIDAAFADATFPKTSLVAAMLDVEHTHHRKEMVLLLCLQQAFGKKDNQDCVTFLTGNQTAVDCLIDALGSQFKSYDFNERRASFCHTVKGVADVAYDVRDGIHWFVTGFLVHCAGRYFFFYARETWKDMLAKGRITDLKNGKTDSNTGFTPRMPDKYHKWLWGETKKHLDTQLNPFARPIEIFYDKDEALTKALLDEVCYEAKDPKGMEHALDPDAPETCTSPLSDSQSAVRKRRRRNGEVTSVQLMDDEKHIKWRENTAKRRAKKKAAKEAAEAAEPPPSDKAKGKRPMVEDDPVSSREDSDLE